MAIQWSITLSDSQIALLIALRDKSDAHSKFPQFITSMRALMREQLVEFHEEEDKQASKIHKRTIVKRWHVVTEKGKAILKAIEYDMEQMKDTALVLRNYKVNTLSRENIRGLK